MQHFCLLQYFPNYRLHSKLYLCLSLTALIYHHLLLNYPWCSFIPLSLILSHHLNNIHTLWHCSCKLSLFEFFSSRAYFVAIILLYQINLLLFDFYHLCVVRLILKFLSNQEYFLDLTKVLNYLDFTSRLFFFFRNLLS